jgi:hypothetical protein
MGEEWFSEFLGSGAAATEDYKGCFRGWRLVGRLGGCGGEGREDMSLSTGEVGGC